MRTERSTLPKRRSLRLQGYDYRATGAYFVTICAAGKYPLFGFIRGGKVHLNNLGQIVNDCWASIELIRKQVSLDAYIVMPNHIHGIIRLTEESEATAIPTRVQGMTSGSLGAILAQYKSIVTKRGQTLAPAAPRQIWQRNYYDHIIRNQKSLDKIRRYIVENPLRWQDDEFYIE